MIEERTVTAADCDACGATTYSENGVSPSFVFKGTYSDTAGKTQDVQFVACRRTHIGKAANAVLDRMAIEQERWEKYGPMTTTEPKP